MDNVYIYTRLRYTAYITHTYIYIYLYVYVYIMTVARVSTESRPDIAFDSDHAVLIIHIRIKLGKKEWLKRKKTDSEPQASRQGYDSMRTFEQTLIMFIPGQYTGEQHCFSHNQSKLPQKSFLTKTPTVQKQPYLFEATWNLIENRQVAREQNNSGLEQQLNAAIKRSAT